MKKHFIFVILLALGTCLNAEVHVNIHNNFSPIENLKFSVEKYSLLVSSNESDNQYIRITPDYDL